MENREKGYVFKQCLDLLVNSSINFNKDHFKLALLNKNFVSLYDDAIWKYRYFPMHLLHSGEVAFDDDTHLLYTLPEECITAYYSPHSQTKERAARVDIYLKTTEDGEVVQIRPDLEKHPVGYSFEWDFIGVPSGQPEDEYTINYVALIRDYKYTEEENIRKNDLIAIFPVNFTTVQMNPSGTATFSLNLGSYFISIGI